MLKYFVELVGTFIFLSVILITGEAIPIGLILTGMVYWGGPISGGAFNPAVSLALLINKTINFNQFIGYCVVQFLGAIGAYYFFKYTKVFTKK